MERLTHEADFGLEDWEETLFFVKSDPNGAYNILDIAKYQGNPEFDEILKHIALRLSSIENILGDDYDLDRLSLLCNQRMTMRDELSQRFSLTAKIPLDRLRELVDVYDTLQEFAEDVARQFGYHGTTPDGRPAYTTGGLSTLEWAWSLLGWPDPKSALECECQVEGCHEWATSGRPTPNGYKWLCSRHFAACGAREEAEATLATNCD